MRGPSKRIRWMLYLVGALTLVVAGPLAFEVFAARAEYAADAATLAAESARARELGLALTSEELTPDWAGTDANAAPLYKKAFAVQKSLPPWVQEKLNPIGPTGPERWNDLRDALEASRPTLALLGQAANRPHCWFDRPTLVLGGGFVDAAALKNAEKLMCARSEFEAHEGRFDAALESLRVAATIARHAGDEPTLIGGLVKIAMDSIVLKTLEHIAVPDAMTPSSQAQARRVLEALGSPDLANVYRGELVYRLSLYDVLREDAQHEAQREQPSTWERLQGWWEGLKGRFSHDPDRIDLSTFYPRFQDLKVVEQAYQARELHRWNTFFEAARTRNGDPGAIARDLADLQAALESGDHRADRPARVFRPATEQVGKAYQRVVARRRLAAQAMIVLAFKHRTGNWPAALADSGEVLMDPFGGKPLRYVPGRMLYSLGVDGKDDSGGEGDEVFEFAAK